MSAARAMLAQKRPDIQIVGDELISLLKVTDFSPISPRSRRRAPLRDHRQLGTGHVAAAQVGGGRRARDRLVHYYASAVAGPTAIKPTGLAHRIFEVQEGFPNSTPRRRKILRRLAKEGMSVWYPRAVNEMNVLAKAITPAKADDAKSIAAQLEGMKIEAFDGGDAWIRKDDHQFFTDLFIATSGRSIRPRSSMKKGPAGAGRPSAPSKRSTRFCRRPARWSVRKQENVAAGDRRRPSAGPEAPMLQLIIFSTLNGVLYGMLLFMMASGLTLIFSMMGVLNFAHASFYMVGAYSASRSVVGSASGPGSSSRRSPSARSGRWSSATACAACTASATFPNCCSLSGWRSSSKNSCRSSGENCRSIIGFALAEFRRISPV